MIKNYAQKTNVPQKVAHEVDWIFDIIPWFIIIGNILK